MVVGKILIVFVDRAPENGVGQRIPFGFDLPAAVDELVTVLGGLDCVEHDGECSAGGVLHAHRHVHTAGGEPVLLVFHRPGADGDIGQHIR